MSKLKELKTILFRKFINRKNNGEESLRKTMIYLAGAMGIGVSLIGIIYPYLSDGLTLGSLFATTLFSFMIFIFSVLVKEISISKNNIINKIDKNGELSDLLVYEKENSREKT